MIEFARAFPTGGMWSDDPTVRELFRHWVFPGEPSGPRGLRVAIRRNYLNLYVQGQSVAHVKVVRDAPVLRASQTYIDGIAKAPGRRPSKRVVVQEDQRSPANVARWIDTAQTFAGDEKRFVDDLVAANPDVIDLEMALGDSRVDLVLVDVADDVPRIVPWEAKCADNPEIRARAPITPTRGPPVTGAHVARQLYKYEALLEDATIRGRVATAYREAARILCNLAERFDRGEPPLAWRRMAEYDGPIEVAARPGLVIGAYRPEGSARTVDLARNIFTWQRDGHRARIEARGYRVESYEEAPRSRLRRLGAD